MSKVIGVIRFIESKAVIYMRAWIISPINRYMSTYNSDMLLTAPTEDDVSAEIWPRISVYSFISLCNRDSVHLLTLF